MKREILSTEKWSEGGVETIKYGFIKFAHKLYPPTAPFPDLVELVVRPPTLVLDERVSVDEAGSRRKWKSFEHYKMVQDDPSSGGPAAHDSAHVSGYTDYRGGHRGHYGSSVYGVKLGTGKPGNYYAPYGLPSWRESTAVDIGFTPLPAQLVYLQQAALNAIMPRIKSEFSVLNAVYELKDFKHLVLTARRTLARVGQLGLGRVFLSSLKNVAAFARKPTLRSLAGLAAGTYLQWKFAIAPLISDINATWRAVSTVESKLRKLLDGVEKVRVGHFSVAYPEYVNDTIITPGWSYQQPFGYPYAASRRFQAWGLTREIAYEPSKFHVEIEYSYCLLDLQVAHSRLFAYLDAFGINLNPAIIWNAIPYTFLLDWVVGVSRFLDGMKAGFMDPMVFIRQYLWSITRERRITGRVRYLTLGATTPGGQEYGLPVCVEQSYRRETQMPSKSSFLQTSGLTPTELSLGTALLVSRRSRRKYRLNR